MIGRSQEEKILSSKLQEAELTIKELTQCNVKLLSERRKLQSRLNQTERDVARLRNEFANMLEMVEQHADFANGVTDPTGSIDEGRVVADRHLKHWRAMIDTAMQANKVE